MALRAQLTSTSEKVVFFTRHKLKPCQSFPRPEYSALQWLFMGNLSDSRIIESTRSSRDAPREAAPRNRGISGAAMGGRNEHTHRVSVRELHCEEPALSSLPPNASRSSASKRTSQPAWCGANRLRGATGRNRVQGEGRDGDSLKVWKKRQG